MLDALTAHPILAPASHCSMILDSQALKADLQARESRNARTNGPADGSSDGPAGTGPRSKGTGQSKGVMVADGE